MIIWSNFDPPNYGSEPEINVALCDYWLRRLAPGPSQAERILENSCMLEQAHERRFAVSQLDGDFSQFERRQCYRIQYCLDWLQAHFDRHRTCEDMGAVGARSDEDLVGMTLGASEDVQCPSSSMFFSSVSIPESPRPQDTPTPGSDGEQTPETPTPPVVTSWPIILDADDNFRSEDVEKMIRSLAKSSRVTTRIFSRGTRTMRSPRMRSMASGAKVQSTSPEPDGRRAKRVRTTLD